MPSLPPRHLLPREDPDINPIATDDGTSLIIGLTISILGLILVLILLKLLLPWIRSYRAAKDARQKALADQKAWYRSTCPVIRRPNTPRLLNAYMRSPHIQSEQEREVQVVGEQWHEQGNVTQASSTKHSRSQSNTTQVPSADALNGLNSIRALVAEPFPPFDPEYRPSMEEESDFGLQRVDTRTTRNTLESVASIGVDVPMRLPVTQMPREAYHSPRSDVERDADIFVVGND